MDREGIRNRLTKNIRRNQEIAKIRYDKKRRPHQKYSHAIIYTYVKTESDDCNPKMTKKFVGLYQIVKVLHNDNDTIR